MYDLLMSGVRTEVYLRLTPKWISALVVGISDESARELSWPENRGRLQCALSIGHLSLREWDSVRLVTPLRTAVYQLEDITIEPTEDNRADVFVIHLGALLRVLRHFG